MNIKSLSLSVIAFLATACNHSATSGGGGDDGNANQLCQDICDADVACGVFDSSGEPSCISTCVDTFVEQLGSDDLPPTVFSCEDNCALTSACGEFQSCAAACE